jgi:hypothetical protein
MQKRETLYPVEILLNAITEVFHDPMIQDEMRLYAIDTLVHAGSHIMYPMKNNPTGAVFALIGQMEREKTFNEPATNPS